jgi:hypothetical protein
MNLISKPGLKWWSILSRLLLHRSISLLPSPLGFPSLQLHHGTECRSRSTWASSSTATAPAKNKNEHHLRLLTKLVHARLSLDAEKKTQWTPLSYSAVVDEAATNPPLCCMTTSLGPLDESEQWQQAEVEPTEPAIVTLIARL